MDKLATIETIHSIEEHPNADVLEKAKILGYDVVVKKGEFKHADKVIFIWPDTVLEPREWNEFLDKKKDGSLIKVRSVKLRGQFSTGVVLPLSIIDGEPLNIENGVSVAELLGVSKYLRPEEIGGSGEAKGAFPSYIIPRTDEDSALSNPDTEDEFYGEECYLTIKNDGTSLTFISLDQEIRVCSRNMEIREGDNMYWKVVNKYEMPRKLIQINIAVQAELCGQSIQSNKLNLKEHTLTVFNVKDLNSGDFLSFSLLKEFCESYGLPMVNLFNEPFLFDKREYTFASIQEMADSVKYGKNPGEGLVLRPTFSKYSSTLGKNLSVKFINRNYSN